MKPVIYCALDTDDFDSALNLCAMMQAAGCGIKLGLEFFSAFGAGGVKEIRMQYPDLSVFLDLKFHDIPNTVAGAVHAASSLNVDFMNVHASGGMEMMHRAKEALDMSPETKLLAVTILISLNDQDLDLIGIHGSPAEQVRRLALLTQEAGLDGVVCAPHEIETLRKACGPDFILMVPGIRPAGSDADDQKRIMTPQQAVSHGARHLVIGRPITRAPDPQQAATEIVKSLM